MRFTVRLCLMLLLAFAVAFLAVPVLVAQPAMMTLPADAGDAAKGLLVQFLTSTRPALVMLLTSGLVWIANKGTGVIAHWSVTAKYFTLAAVGILASAGVAAMGGDLSADVSTWTRIVAEGLAGGGVSAVIYKLGGTR